MRKNSAFLATAKTEFFIIGGRVADLRIPTENCRDGRAEDLPAFGLILVRYKLSRRHYFYHCDNRHFRYNLRDLVPTFATGYIFGIA